MYLQRWTSLLRSINVERMLNANTAEGFTQCTTTMYIDITNWCAAGACTFMGHALCQHAYVCQPLCRSLLEILTVSWIGNTGTIQAMLRREREMHFEV